MFTSAEGVDGRKGVSDIMQHSTRSLPLSAGQNLGADLQAGKHFVMISPLYIFVYVDAD